MEFTNIDDANDYIKTLEARIKTLGKENELNYWKCASPLIYSQTYPQIKKLNQSNYMGSAIYVTLHKDHKGGHAKIMDTFVISDGFSEETIKGLLKDIRKSYELTTMYKLPKED